MSSIDLMPADTTAIGVLPSAVRSDDMSIAASQTQNSSARKGEIGFRNTQNRHLNRVSNRITRQNCNLSTQWT